MIVDRVRTVSVKGLAKRAARVRWRGGRFELFVRGPSEVLAPEDDASAFVVMALLPAMARGEDLEIDGLVSSRLMSRLPTVLAAYSAWNPRLRPPEVTVRDVGRLDRDGAGIGCFFSRGVDSLFSAALRRDRRASLTHLVFCDGLEPRHTRAVANHEIRRSSAAAAALGLPLLTVTTNVRRLTDACCGWGDAHGSALAGIALALSGAFRRLVIPSTESFASLGPYGSSPLVDSLLSSEAVEVVHDDVALTRAGKVACLAAQRPDLLEYLKVCYAENRPDNCGQCGKCLVTMAALEAADALPLAKEFPSSIDLEVIRTKRIKSVGSRMQYEAVIRALGASGRKGELRSAMLEAMKQEAARSDDGEARSHPLWKDPWRSFQQFHQNRLIALLDYGEPFPPLSDAPEREYAPVALRPASSLQR